MPIPPGKQRTALEAAQRLLSFRDHGREELRRKLRSRGFPARAVEEALAHLESGGLLNDGKYTESVIRRELEGGHGPAFIRAKLRKQGLAADGIPISFEEEAASLRRLLERKRVQAKSLTGPKERSKMLRFLRGRGYTAAAVEAVLGPMAEEGQD